ncbi:MAG: hypothetical protein HS120_04315 [Burkholderiales bacterium]|nr:hypothetical protein [Burkholderiales bacterium]
MIYISQTGDVVLVALLCSWHWAWSNAIAAESWLHCRPTGAWMKSRQFFGVLLLVVAIY